MVLRRCDLRLLDRETALEEKMRRERRKSQRGNRGKKKDEWMKEEMQRKQGSKGGRGEYDLPRSSSGLDVWSWVAGLLGIKVVVVEGAEGGILIWREESVG